ncbi:topoisomerase DNA-binding C4 zinc finger domain-containing protein [Paenibacillus qinlingensis]|uniref:DNA topoisomerase type IA zn finger domain-containing protein n=1 Tax=Paenibacillus qinlingensis TaxID=1837343 RepID=A0ABU1P516_9BACL|nr:topoisomerase DNA-binding C4 zinc finger domain-containing protein [Paenibacillus qinlingensis]MDR6554669.1 hypothetical protein [Paenibacillus qinlingensis]
MNSELSQLATQSFVAPFYFIAMCIALFTFIGALLYYRFLSKWLPEKLATLVWFIGAVFILFTSSERFDDIKGFVKNWTITGMGIGVLISVVALGVIGVLLVSKKKGSVRKRKVKTSSFKVQGPRMVQNRSDQEILNSSLDILSGAEMNKKIKVQPVKDIVRKEVLLSQAQVAAAKETTCTCGAPMVTRKGREGKAFLGCSTFPKCRQTRSV